MVCYKAVNAGGKEVFTYLAEREATTPDLAMDTCTTNQPLF
jgi:hypothetical protein